jgi:stage II sporulation protein D
MKGYAVFLLSVACLLMLLPIPALPKTQASVLPPASDPAQSEPTASNDAVPQVASFKILNGDTIIELSCREFLIRTLAFEMSPTYHPEALKAQAVAAYTYYGRRQRTQAVNPDPTLKGADFKTPDPKFPQEYTVEKLRERWGDKFDTYYGYLATAVDAVTGRHITYNGEWIDACFCAMSNGSTESAEVVWSADVPYLQTVASPGDRLSQNYETTATITVEQVRSALMATDATLSLGEDPSKWFGEPTLSAAGTVASIPVGNKTLAGTAVRTALNLRSATFSIKYADGNFTFTVRGYGHGVGMSQVGANALAQQGYAWQEILTYYYTGVTIE